MAYCRFTEDGSDVYLYHSVYGCYECCGCRLTSKIDTVAGGLMHDNVQMETAEDCLEHLQEHLDAGHCVPDRPFERLREELSENSP